MMVSLSSVSASNSLISKVIPAGLVAVFFGGTSGIGEITVKTLAKYARSPRIYIVGRSQDAADRILAECKAINPDGEFIFMKADVSLIRNVDQLSNEIKAKEKFLNLLFLTAGVANIDRARKVTKCSG
jgi:NADP-dependent 3-hydroxy acid dehydrogenase YdfG